LKQVMHDQNDLEEISGTISKSHKMISAIYYHANYVSWQSSEGKLHQIIQLYKDSHRPGTCEECALSANLSQTLSAKNSLTYY